MALIRRSKGHENEIPLRRKCRLPPGTQRRSALKASLPILILGLLIATLAPTLPLNAEQTKGLGMWVWSDSSFSTQEAREQLVQFCVRYRITHLDVHVKMAHASGTPLLQNAQAFRDLIALAGQHNMTIAALRGNPKMFFSENHERTLEELRAIVAFSETLPQDSSFKGLKYDVEPYCTKEWKAGRTPLYPMMQDYLAFLRKARSVLEREAPHLWLAVDTPFWWDKDQFALEFEGTRKRFSEHVQDLTDFITIMSYRRSPQKVLGCVEGERKYARRTKKVIFPSLETVRLKQDAHISFWGVSNEEFWKVVPELLQEAKEDPAMGGVMIHCYRSLFDKFTDDTLHQTGQVASDGP